MGSASVLEMTKEIEEGLVVTVFEAMAILGVSRSTVERNAKDYLARRGSSRNGPNVCSLYWRDKIEAMAAERKLHKCGVCNSVKKSPAFATCGHPQCVKQWRRIRNGGADVSGKATIHGIERMDSVGAIKPIADSRTILQEWQNTLAPTDSDRYMLVAQKCRTNVATVYSVVRRMQTR
jgi:hypothetical protein